MTLAIFFEGGSTGEPEIGMRHIARVIAERAKANRTEWGGNTICGVVFYKSSNCQFSFACLPLARRTPKPGPAWDASARNRARAARGPQRRDAGADPLLHERAALQSAATPALFRKEFVRVDHRRPA